MDTAREATPPFSPSPSQVVHLRGCTGGEYTLPAETTITKVFVEDCRRAHELVKDERSPRARTSLWRLFETVGYTQQGVHVLHQWTHHHRAYRGAPGSEDTPCEVCRRCSVALISVVNLRSLLRKRQVWRSNDIVFEVGNILGTLQADQCSGLRLRYLSRALMGSVVFSGVSKLFAHFGEFAMPSSQCPRGANAPGQVLRRLNPRGSQ